MRGFLDLCVLFANMNFRFVSHSDSQFHANCSIAAGTPQHLCNKYLLREQGKPYGGANIRFLLIPEDVACWLPDTLAVVIRQKQSR
jgi:hypothetical protein